MNDEQAATTTCWRNFHNFTVNISLLKVLNDRRNSFHFPSFLNYSLLRNSIHNFQFCLKERTFKRAMQECVAFVAQLKAQATGNSMQQSEKRSPVEFRFTFFSLPASRNPDNSHDVNYRRGEERESSINHFPSL